MAKENKTNVFLDDKWKKSRKLKNPLSKKVENNILGQSLPFK